MANRNFEEFSLSLIKKKVDLCGAISLSAAGAVLSHSIAGAETVVKGGVGEYILTLEDKYSRCLAVHASIAETSQDLDARPGVVDVAGAKTIVIKTKTAGADANASATAKIYVTITLSNSSVV